MNRKALLRDIQIQNNRLNVNQARLMIAREHAEYLFSQYRPYLIVCVGFFAGITTRTVDWRKVYRVAKVGVRLYSLTVNKSE